jgi:hypothetical protein
VQGVGNALHWRTREETVRRELRFAVGEPCDQRRLDETERLLRAQPYLRSAAVAAHEGAQGTVDVTVLTGDDWSLRGSARLETGGPRGPVRRLRLAEENLWGRGLRAQVRFNNEGREPGVDLAVSTRHFFGHHDADAVLGASSVGALAEQSVLRPFATEFDRTAWREATRYRKEPFLFTSPFGTVVQPTVTTGADVGVARRFGRPRRLLIVGGLLSYERLFVEGPAFGSRPETDSAAAASLAGRYTERRRLRVHALVGARRLRFAERRGVDAVNAAEDIRLGFEGGIVAGRSLFAGDGLQPDHFLAAELYTGFDASRALLLFARGKWEGRWRRDARAWDGVVASADVVAYHTVGATRSLVIGLSAAGGWNNSTPFQLTLAGAGGVRGYGASALAVARRVVLHLDRREFHGTVGGAIDVGSSLFVDVGQGWAGRVPFGRNTGLIGDIGAGLRVAFPSGSRLTYRLDLAMPLSGGGGLELRTGFRQHFGIQRGEAEDVVRSREQVSSVTVFNFPRF